MSRIANNPVEFPQGVEFNLDGKLISIKGSKGQLEHEIHSLVDIAVNESILKVSTKSTSKHADALAGTTCAIIQNMVRGVSQGFEKKLTLIGIGYRAQVKGKTLNLTLGFSHPVNFEVPEGIVIETPSQTEIIVKGCDKQKVGQVAANIRAYRPPEPYKGKGVRYADEQVVRKEAKKK